MLSSRSVGVSAALFLLVGCQATMPEKATVLSQPTTPIVKNITSFSNALRCMDELFLAYGKRNIVITSDGLPDETNMIFAGTKDMMITTLSKLAEKSGSFKFVDVDERGTIQRVQADVQRLQKRYGRAGGYQLPQFYIRGAITQLDKGIAVDSSTIGISFPWVNPSFSKDQSLATMTIDLNIGDVVKHQIIPGMHTTNTITLISSGKSFDTEGIIKKANVFFDVVEDRSQGTHQSLRTLLELSLIEVLGKFTRVPYWRCLGLETSDPTLIAESRDWYDSLSEQKLRLAVQTALYTAQYYNGELDGQPSEALTLAIQKYQASHDLIANGTIDFDLYYQLLADNRAVVPSSVDDEDEDEASTLTTLTSRRQDDGHFSASKSPIGLNLKVLSDGFSVLGEDPVFYQGDTFQLEVSVENSATVHCFFEYHVDHPQDRRTRVVKIFPNEWQTDGDLFLGQTVTVPSSDAEFSLLLERADVNDSVACIALGEDSLLRHPVGLSENSLDDLQGYQTVSEVIDAYQNIDRLNIDVQYAQIKVHRP